MLHEKMKQILLHMKMISIKNFASKMLPFGLVVGLMPHHWIFEEVIIECGEASKQIPWECQNMTKLMKTHLVPNLKWHHPKEVDVDNTKKIGSAAKKHVSCFFPLHRLWYPVTSRIVSISCIAYKGQCARNHHIGNMMKFELTASKFTACYFAFTRRVWS